MTVKKKGQAAIAFGLLLRDRRRELRLTQQEVADAAGIDRTLLSDYERPGAPERTPTDDTLFGLAKALDVQPEMLFDWAGVRFPHLNSHRVAPPPELYDRLDKLESLIVALSARIEELSGPPPAAKRPRRPRPS